MTQQVRWDGAGRNRSGIGNDRPRPTRRLTRLMTGEPGKVARGIPGRFYFKEEDRMARIAVYLTGSIAAYKAVSVVRELQRAGHEVRVAQTKAAEQFVGPATLASLTHHPVVDDLWEMSEGKSSRSLSRLVRLGLGGAG